MGAVDLFDFGGLLGRAGSERLVVRTTDDLQGEQVFPVAKERRDVDGKRLATALVQSNLTAVEEDTRSLLDA